MPITKEAPRGFPELLRARCPATFPPAVESAAKLHCMKPSEYIRHSVFQQLKADGIDVAERCDDTKEAA